ncbi:MAG: Y-family DNA polymerase [Nitrososphaeraceae archaeon]
MHGIVIAKSYECKPYGIKTGTTLSDALRMCPNLLVVQGDHLFYQLLSGELREFLQTKIPVLEQYSIDEFPGIGKALSKRLGSYKIKTLGEVLISALLLQSWGRVGEGLD